MAFNLNSNWSILILLLPLLILSQSASFSLLDKVYLKSGKGRVTAIKAGICVWLLVLPMQILIKSVLNLPSFLGFLILGVAMSFSFDYFYDKNSKKKALFLFLSYLCSLLILFLGMVLSVVLLPRFI